MAPTQGDKVVFVGVFAGEDDHSSGEQTPAGFQDTPGQWYSAIQRKRGTAAADDGEATLRDSQETQPQSDAVAEAATEPVTQAEGRERAPVFVYATRSLGDENGDSRFHNQQQQQDEEIDEDETQIIMSLSQDPYGKCWALCMYLQC